MGTSGSERARRGEPQAWLRLMCARVPYEYDRVSLLVAASSGVEKRCSHAVLEASLGCSAQVLGR